MYIELTKPVFQREGNAAERDVTMRVLWTCLDRAMRLFHPIMPYVTEELWQRLPGRGSIPDEPPSIMLASYPKPQSYWSYPESVEPMALVLATVRVLFSLVLFPPIFFFCTKLDFVDGWSFVRFVLSGFVTALTGSAIRFETVAQRKCVPAYPNGGNDSYIDGAFAKLFFS